MWWAIIAAIMAAAAIYFSWRNIIREPRIDSPEPSPFNHRD